MALCLFKCLAACGFRDCLMKTFAYYPPTPGYRFQENETRESSSSSYSENKGANNHNKNNNNSRLEFEGSTSSTTSSPVRIREIASYNKRSYSLVLVYQKSEMVNNGSNSEKEDVQKKPSASSDKKEKKSKQKSSSQLSEELFTQVEDLNLICFKRQRSSTSSSILCGYHIENTKRKSETVVIYSHGNSTDIGYMINQALDMSYNIGVNVIAYDYSGYGCSTGKPSDTNFIYDLESIYSLAIELGYLPVNIILYGQSIGSGPSTFLASQATHAVGGLVIHSGFTSGLRITQNQADWEKRTHKKDLFPTIDLIRSVNAPVLIIHGTDDQDIGISHASRLYENVKAQYTPFFMPIEGGGHNDIEISEQFRKPYYLKLREFFRFLKKKKEGHLFGRESVTRGAGIDATNIDAGYSGDGFRNSFRHIYRNIQLSACKVNYVRRGESAASQKTEDAAEVVVLQNSRNDRTSSSLKENVRRKSSNSSQKQLEQSYVGGAGQRKDTRNEEISVVGSLKHVDIDLFEEEEEEKERDGYEQEGRASGGEVEERQEIRSYRATSVVRQTRHSYFSSVILDAASLSERIDQNESIRSLQSSGQFRKTSTTTTGRKFTPRVRAQTNNTDSHSQSGISAGTAAGKAAGQQQQQQFITNSLKETLRMHGEFQESFDDQNQQRHSSLNEEPRYFEQEVSRTTKQLGGVSKGPDYSNSSHNNYVMNSQRGDSLQEIIEEEADELPRNLPPKISQIDGSIIVSQHSFKSNVSK